MSTNDFFHYLSITSTVTEHLRQRIRNSKEEDWKDIIEMSCLSLTIDDFISEPSLVKFINDMNCHNKLAIYRFKPNTCYNWHIDHAGRNSCINMLIDGYDSITMFGNPTKKGRLQDITKVMYEPNKYVLLDVHRFHIVFNFSKDRYLLSIGVPSPTTYNDVKQYIMDNNL